MRRFSEMSAEELNAIELLLNGFEGALLIDEQGIIRIITDYYAKEAGISKAEVLGRHVLEVFPDSRMIEVLESARPILTDLWILNKKSQIVTRLPVVYDGQVMGVVGISIFRYMDQAQSFARRVQNSFSELKYYKEEVRRLSAVRYSLEGIVGESEGIWEAKERVKVVAPLQVPVHIYGATGTGKELFAHALHQESPRRDKPFIRINCAGIPDTLIESELFGYAEGAFTGARRGGKAGKFELAHRGTIFLDEVSELSWAAQAKLLRVLQDHEVERVGGTENVEVDVRVISASNQSLNQLVADGKFRKDLLFRLNVFTITIPPLRERQQDIPLLVNSFIEDYNRENGTNITGLTAEALLMLNTYHWPGNVRELFTAVERACIDARVGSISSENLLRYTGLSKKKHDVEGGYAGFDLRRARAEAERETILRALRACGDNRSKTAEMLGLSRSALYQKMRQLDLEPEKA